MAGLLGLQKWLPVDFRIEKSHSAKCEKWPSGSCALEPSESAGLHQGGRSGMISSTLQIDEV